MAYQSIGLGSSADDGTGDSLRVGGDKVNDNFVEVYTLLGTGTALTTGMSATGSVVTLTAATVATSIAPNSSDGASLGTTSLEWSDLYIADGGIIYFGDDQEITLTHVHDDGLILKHVGTGDGKEPSLSFHAGDNDIAINDVLGSIFFKAPDEGAGTDAILVAAGVEAVSEGDFSSSNNATKLSFLTAASEAASEKMSLSSAGLLTIADDLMIKDGGTIGVASTNDAITISSAGIVTLKDDLVIKDGGTIGVTSAATAITVASSGIVTFVDDLVIKDGGTIGVTSAATAITISAAGIVTLVDDLLLKDACTIGTATTAGAISIAADGTVNLATAGATVNSVAAKVAGTETMWIPAASMYPNTTAGCAALAQVELSNGPEIKVLDFDASSDENAQFAVAFPKSWNEGTVTFQAFFTVTGTNTGTTAWGLSAVALADDGSLNTAFGTNVVATAKAHSGTSNDLDVSAVSGAVTIAGSPSVNEYVFFQIMRDVSADDQSGDARLLGIKLFFTTDAANDA
jgi:flagellar basal body rod protein FlgF|tara:strand:+ start:885 stop:2432 length:1548 start_codon:yes stop_codon:yes gene_type:complete